MNKKRWVDSKWSEEGKTLRVIVWEVGSKMIQLRADWDSRAFKYHLSYWNGNTWNLLLNTVGVQASLALTSESQWDTLIDRCSELAIRLLDGE